MTNYKELNLRLQHLRRDIQLMLNQQNNIPLIAEAGSGRANNRFKKFKTLLIAPNEVNLHHGTGVLLNRLFSPETTFVLRSQEFYADKGSFSSSVLPASNRSRKEIHSMVMAALEGLQIEKILCVPYLKEDFGIAVAAKNILGVPMVTWVMDDNHIHTGEVPKDDALELFRASSICFAISSELRDAYQTLFEHKFYVLPPIVSSASLNWLSGQVEYSKYLRERTCAMVGNIWGVTWLRRILPLIQESGWKVHWFGRGSACEWLKTTPEELQAHGIYEQGFLDEKDLAERLSAYPFVIVPTGIGDKEDDRSQVTMLSLPTRLPFLLAVAKMPVLVVGSAKSCSARFLHRFGVGYSCASEIEAFRSALLKMTDPGFNAACRRNATALAPMFSDQDLEPWIWQSCRERVPADDRFEGPFCQKASSLVPFHDDPVPEDLYKEAKSVFSVMRRLAKRKYNPDFVFDVGASTGVWSDTVLRLFPAARYILVEPLAEKYPQWYFQKNKKFELVATAVSNHHGKAIFQVASDLYNSSLLPSQDGRAYQQVEINVDTVDAIRRKKKLTGRGILKIDVQYAEHLVLEGARELLEQVDFLVLELTLRQVAPGAKTFSEMIKVVESWGFHYFDDIGTWRHPSTGDLKEKDVIFASADVLNRLKTTSGIDT